MQITFQTTQINFGIVSNNTLWQITFPHMKINNPFLHVNFAICQFFTHQVSNWANKFCNSAYLISIYANPFSNYKNQISNYVSHFFKLCKSTWNIHNWFTLICIMGKIVYIIGNFICISGSLICTIDLFKRKDDMHKWNFYLQNRKMICVCGNLSYKIYSEVNS